MLRILILFSLLILLIGGWVLFEPQIKSDSGELVWSDEFDYEGLPDPVKWSYAVGNGCPHLCGWGNNELQYYTEKQLKNARVENGHLVLEAHRETQGENAFTSARLLSKGKGDWQYGRIEIRAQLPKGRGTWAAIWMMPTDRKYGNWPACGEIDIMEYVGFEPDSVFGTVHTGAFNHLLGTQDGGRVLVPDVNEAFHVYSVEWDAQQIRFQLDGETYHRFENRGTGVDAWPFDQAFHLILNVAVGGNWGGKMGVDPAIWPQQMLIDYVRVYAPTKKDNYENE